MAISNTDRGLRPGVCTSTTRPTAPYEGQMIYETDTNRVLVWDNAAWVMIADTDTPPGLQLIKSGTLSLTTSATNVESVFSSEFKNYRLLIYIPTRSTTNRVDMRYITGTTAETTNYFQGGIASDHASNTTFYYQRSSNDPQFYGLNTSNELSISLDIFAPNRSGNTLHQGNSTDRIGGLSYSIGGMSRTNNQFTGFQLFTSTGTATAEYQVFGYRD